MAPAVTSPDGLEAGQAKPAAKKSNLPMIIGLIVLLLVIAAGAVVAVIFLTASGGWIKGSWVTNYDTYITVTDTHWYAVSSWGTTVYTINSLTPGYVIMQNPSTDAWNPSKFTKNEFHGDATSWGFCSSVYNADTAQAAIDTDTSEIYTSSDAEAGCNGFPHTQVTPYANPFLGTWTTNFGSTITINDTHWASVSSWGSSARRIEAYGADFVLMQNPSDDSFNPDLWTVNKIHTVGTGFGFCSIVYNGASATAALTADFSAYSATNATAGCNGFGHTIASPA